jgi:hypothetical protein
VIVNPSGSGIVVNEELGGVFVGGAFQGQGGTAAPTFFDLGVGLNLDGLRILGGNTTLNSLINANIRAGGSISGNSRNSWRRRAAAVRSSGRRVIGARPRMGAGSSPR